MLVALLVHLFIKKCLIIMRVSRLDPEFRIPLEEEHVAIQIFLPGESRGLRGPW